MPKPRTPQTARRGKKAAERATQQVLNSLSRLAAVDILLSEAQFVQIREAIQQKLATTLRRIAPYQPVDFSLGEHETTPSEQSGG